jgi:hypothetical protein
MGVRRRGLRAGVVVQPSHASPARMAAGESHWRGQINKSPTKEQNAKNVIYRTQ